MTEQIYTIELRPKLRQSGSCIFSNFFVRKRRFVVSSYIETENHQCTIQLDERMNAKCQAFFS